MSTSIFAYECPITHKWVPVTQISLPFEPLDALAVKIIPAYIVGSGINSLSSPGTLSNRP